MKKSVEMFSFSGILLKLATIPFALSNETLYSKIESQNGRPSGFDYLRIVLAFSVFLIHSLNLPYRRESLTGLWTGPISPVILSVLPMFFSLSGFLVAGSLYRSRSVFGFLGLRVIRIAPALIFDTLISALIIGPIFTTLQLSEYFRSSTFVAYFLNIVGLIHYHLPGVFASNPESNFVNGQLWTLPYELYCYLLLGGLAVIGIHKRKLSFLILVMLSNLMVGICSAFFVSDSSILSIHGPVLIFCFLYGILGYVQRNEIPWRIDLFLASIIFCYLSLRLRWDYLLPFPITYMTAYLGVMALPRYSPILKDDYSYGLFLFGFPIQQGVVAATSDSYRTWYINLLIALPVTVTLSIISWRFVEQPAKSLRQRVLDIEGLILGEFKNVQLPKVSLLFKTRN